MRAFFLSSHQVEEARELCGVSIPRGLLPLLRVPPSCPKHLSKAPLSKTITMGSRFQHREFWGDANIQIITHTKEQSGQGDSPPQSPKLVSFLQLTWSACQFLADARVSSLSSANEWSLASSALQPATLKTLITFLFSHSETTLSFSFSLFCKFLPSSCFRYQSEDILMSCAHTH